MIHNCDYSMSLVVAVTFGLDSIVVRVYSVTFGSKFSNDSPSIEIVADGVSTSAPFACRVSCKFDYC